MKLRPLIVALSLAANVALLFAIAQRSPRWADFFTSHTTTPEAAANAAKASADPTPKPDVLAQDTWPNLSTGDMQAVVARLRAEGFPPNLQRAIISALIAQQFADRHHALAELIKAQPWWTSFNSAASAKIMATRQQLQRDEKDAIDALLGANSGTTAYAHAQQVRKFGELPAEKLSTLNQIDSDYNDLINEVRRNAQGILLKEDRDKIAYLEKEKRDDITKVLTPDELFEYDLRSSPTASSLRTQLAAFSPTEAEFRAIFKAQQAFDAQYGGGSFEMMTAEQRRARAQDQAKLTEQIQPLLTPERFDEYKLKTDPQYIQANALVTRLQLPPTATMDIVTVQKDISKRAETIRGDRSISAEQRSTQLNALGREAEVRLTPILGDSGLSAYKQSSGGWINMLQRQTPTGASKQ